MKKKEQQKINPTLVNMISPMSFSHSKKFVEIGENTGSVYGVTRYSHSVDYGWMEPIMNIPGTMASVYYHPLPESETMDVINNNMANLRRKMAERLDDVTQKKCETELEHSDRMLDDLYSHSASVGAVSTTVMALASEKRIDKVISRLKGEMKKGLHTCKNLSASQKEGYLHMSPCGTMNNHVTNMLQSMVPLRSIVGGFPFASSGFNDGSGYLFGTLSDTNNAASSNMILDIWKRGQDRNNSHMVIMGEPGSGKSTKLKDIMLMEYAMGTRLMAIDPEREQRQLCKKLNGDWINAGGGNGKINPLQVRVLPKEDDDLSVDEIGLPSLASYLMHLKAWFQMACPDISQSQVIKLEDLLILTYERFGMNFETDYQKIKNNQYPIMTDLLETIESELERIKSDKVNDKSGIIYEQGIQDILALRDYVANMATGSLSYLWNGHTTLGFNSNYVVIDTYDLQDAPDYVKGAQYYNILTWMWLEAARDRKEKVMIVADEAYLMIDRKIPQALTFLRNSLKRGRKYEISFVLVSHSVVDFLDESIKQYGQAILDSSSIKILMGCDGQNLEETKDLYHLSEAEEEVLSLKQRGLALMIIGKMHMKVMFEIADYKWDYFGSAGGR